MDSGRILGIKNKSIFTANSNNNNTQLINNNNNNKSNFNANFTMIKPDGSLSQNHNIQNFVQDKYNTY